MYLTEEEQKMPLESRLLQYVLGLQSCQSKGEVVELLNEVYQMGRKDAIGRYVPLESE